LDNLLRIPDIDDDRVVFKNISGMETFKGVGGGYQQGDDQDYVNGIHCGGDSLGVEVII